MAKVSYSNMKLKTDTSVNTIDFNGTKIEVLKYLPIEEKYDLISITMQNALENGVYNGLKLDMYFHLYMVYLYTNINFTDKQKENETKLYDELKSNGLLDLIITNIPDNEYNETYDFMQEIIADTVNYKASASALIQSIITDLPTQAQAAMDIVNNFDPDKFQAVKDFAKAANGGREIE